MLVGPRRQPSIQEVGPRGQSSMVVVGARCVSWGLCIGGLGARRFFQAEFVINRLTLPRKHVYILQ